MEIYRPEFFKLLSNCFLLPDDNLKEAVLSLEQLAAEVYPQWQAEAGEMVEALEHVETIEHLQVEFSKLFIGPYKMMAPPYESLYRDGEAVIMGESTMKILQLYKEAGFDLAETYRDAPDHVATELEFLYILFSQTNAFRISGDEESAMRCEKLSRSLVLDHLAVWIPELADRIEKNTESGFFKALARITENVVLAESAACETP